jgi:hypothetical protein
MTFLKADIYVQGGYKKTSYFKVHFCAAMGSEGSGSIDLK